MFVLEQIIGVVAPHNCLVCGAEGRPICRWCFYEACPALPARCYKCYAATPDSAVCAKCRRTSPLKHVWVRTDYDGYARRLVHALKFERMQAVAPILAEYCKETLPYQENILIVPVPTASSRRRLRGYDQSKLIARSLAARTKYKYQPLLGRLGQTRQVGTKRAERASQLEGAFWVTRPEAASGAHILLIDDVLTTGATIEAAARTLKKAGAKTINAFVFAQKQ